MAADGITIITIAWLDCFNVYGPGDFRLDMMAGPVIEDGGVSTTPDGTRVDLVTIPAAFIDGCWYAEGYYRVPDEFNRGGDENVPVRGVDIEARFIPQTGGPAILTIFVDLVRPPVVFVHGLWSGADTWTFGLIDSNVFPIKQFASYRDDAARSFSVNRRVVYDAIDNALGNCRDAAIRCTRVDVVAHSMGGLLARLHSNSARYATALNRFHGNVRKLIALDTPHTGSPLANLLSALARDPTAEGAVMREVFRSLDMPIDEGGIFDLSTDSTPITTLQECPIPAHALVGIGGQTSWVRSFCLSGPFSGGSSSRASSREATSSGLCSTTSLSGGRARRGASRPRPRRSSASPTGGIHIGIPFVTVGNTGSAVYGDLVRELLDTRTSENVWALLPAASSLQGGTREISTNWETQLADARARAEGADRALEGAFDLTITSPAPGTVVIAGSAVTVTVSVEPGVTVDQIVVAGRHQAVNDTSAPFQVSFDVPLSAFRGYEIRAFGKNNTTNEYFLSAPVELIAQPSAALQSLQIDPTTASILGPGNTLGAVRSRGLFGRYSPPDSPFRGYLDTARSGCRHSCS
ncbi:MAG: alpha/beta fold hydrolase [Thermoanaerobaculia bacterium]|nr:alpha/beta fold hydrolase [Thermoanaerobaculia bacterium]